MPIVIERRNEIEPYCERKSCEERWATEYCSQDLHMPFVVGLQFFDAPSTLNKIIKICNNINAKFRRPESRNSRAKSRPVRVLSAVRCHCPLRVSDHPPSLPPFLSPINVEMGV